MGCRQSITKITAHINKMLLIKGTYENHRPSNDIVDKESISKGVILSPSNMPSTINLLLVNTNFLESIDEEINLKLHNFTGFFDNTAVWVLARTT